MRSVFGCFGIALVFLFTCNTASAQVLGPFRWQLAPHCNVLTLKVQDLGSGTFGLSGFDDLCGAPQRAPVTGVAQLNGDGKISFAVTTTRADGITISTSAVISLPSIVGPWSDDYANTGTLVFNPPSPSGEPRRVTLTGPVSVQFNATAADQSGSASFSLGRAVAPILNIQTVPMGAANPNCPGTAAAPKAAPGFLCLFEGSSPNVHAFDLSRLDDTGLQRTIGGRAVAVATAAGPALFVGTWAVTIP